MNNRNAAILTVAVLTVGCGDEPAPKAELVLSPMFSVCVDSDENAEYSLDTRKPVDWDSGLMHLGGESSSIYVGLHPQASRSEQSRSMGIPAGKFTLVSNNENGSLFASPGFPGALFVESKVQSGSGEKTQNLLESGLHFCRASTEGSRAAWEMTTK